MADERTVPVEGNESSKNLGIEMTHDQYSQRAAAATDSGTTTGHVGSAPTVTIPPVAVSRAGTLLDTGLLQSNRPVFVKPKMSSFGKMGSVSEEYLTNRKARLERLRKQMIQKNKKPSHEEDEQEDKEVLNDITETKKRKPLRNVFTRMEGEFLRCGYSREISVRLLSCY